MGFAGAGAPPPPPPPPMDLDRLAGKVSKALKLVGFPAPLVSCTKDGHGHVVATVSLTAMSPMTNQTETTLVKQFVAALKKTMGRP